jgi:transposase
VNAPVPGAVVADPSMEDLDQLLERVKAHGVDPKDTEMLEWVVASYARVTDLIRDKQTTLARLRQMLFGSTSEKKEDVLARAEAAAATAANAATATASSPASAPAAPPAAPVKGHGRNGASAYPGAARVAVPHPSLHNGDACPHCQGRVYVQKEPRALVRIRGMAPIGATIYEQQELRCNLCGEVYTAPSLPGIGDEKYDATAIGMVAFLRYGSGMPFYRIERMQEAMGIPLPASTQWDLVDDAAPDLFPVLLELVRLAAQGEVLHNDDTPMVILAYLREERDRKERGEKPSERTGVFTTGIVALVGERRIVLYATGHRHAGENLFEVLRRREAALPPPIQMCDGLERNLPGDLKTIVSNCLTHGRRQFVDVVDSFPTEVTHVIEELAIVYRVDAATRGLTPAERLRLHQEESGPVMARLRIWLDELLAQKKVEPNSALGKAVAYAQKRWGRMTLFLRQEGAPIDNNICERILKRAILHRKNSLFYKTEHGAHVGDLYMSLIATARLADADPFDYLVQLQRHPKRVRETPSDWMPWNYRETVAEAIAAPPSPPT